MPFETVAISFNTSVIIGVEELKKNLMFFNWNKCKECINTFIIKKSLTQYKYSNSCSLKFFVIVCVMIYSKTLKNQLTRPDLQLWTVKIKSESYLEDLLCIPASSFLRYCQFCKQNGIRFISEKTRTYNLGSVAFETFYINILFLFIFKSWLFDTFCWFFNHVLKLCR